MQIYLILNFYVIEVHRNSRNMSGDVPKIKKKINKSFVFN